MANDLDHYVVARNLHILLLIGEGEIDAAIQLWYIPAVTDKAWSVLTAGVKKQLSEFLRTGIDSNLKDHEPVFHKIVFGESQVNCCLSKSA